MSLISGLVMGLGIFFAIIGIILFIAKGTEGQNTLKFLGMEFQLSGSSLVFFIVGVVLIVLPFAKKEWFPSSPAGEADPTSIHSGNDRAKAERLVIKGDALLVKERFERVDSAESYYSQAIELSADYDYAIAQRARVRLQKREFIPATEDAMKAISMKPDNGEYHDILARICLVRGDTARACEEWKKSFRNGSAKQTNLIEMLCGKSVATDSDTKGSDTKKNIQPTGTEEDVADAITTDDLDETVWTLRCDFFDGGQAYINNNNEIYMNYLGQLIPIGKKKASSDPRFAWIYLIETGSYLDLYNNLMGTNQYGVDKKGVLWGQSLYGLAQVGKVRKL